MFKVSLVLLLQRRPDRLLIEPTGLAALSGILDTLEQPGIQEAVDVRSVICIMDPTRLEEALRREEIQDQVEAADILLANRSDLASQQQLDSFYHWSNHLFPKKMLVSLVVKGKIPLDYLNLISDRKNAISTSGHRHGTDHEESDVHGKQESDTSSQLVSKDIICNDTQPIVPLYHHSEQISTLGWICLHTIVFDSERIFRWLSEIFDMSSCLRIKAVLRTSDGWRGFNFVNGCKNVEPNGYRRDSRLEILFQNDTFPTMEYLENHLRDCIVLN